LSDKMAASKSDHHDLTH